MDDQTPLMTIIIMAIIAWMVLISFFILVDLGFKNKLDAYFAKRRHDRREAQIRQRYPLYPMDTTKVGGIPYGSARHRR